MRSPSSNNYDPDHELKKGPWTPEEDEKLIDYIKKHGQGSWQLLPRKAGLNRCGKSCRLRWTNYLRPDIKRGNFSPDEEQTIIHLHSLLGNKWSMIATRLPGRTDNEIKNFWNTHLKKRLLRSGIDPKTHQPIIINTPLQNLAKIQLLCNIVQLLRPQTLSQFDGLVNGTVNPLQAPSVATNMEPIEPFSGGSEPVFDPFGAVPELLDSRNNGVISSTAKNDGEYWLPALEPATPEVFSGGQVHGGGSYVQIPTYNELSASRNYDDVWGAVMDDEANSSCWKDVFNESFPSPSL